MHTPSPQPCSPPHDTSRVPAQPLLPSSALCQAALVPPPGALQPQLGADLRSWTLCATSPPCQQDTSWGRPSEAGLWLTDCACP